MDVSGQRQQLFLLDHDDGFLPGGFGCFLQVELFLHRDHKHVVLSALSLGYQSLEHLIRILTQESGYIDTAERGVFFVKMACILDLQAVQHPHDIGFPARFHTDLPSLSAHQN